MNNQEILGALKNIKNGGCGALPLCYTNGEKNGLLEYCLDYWLGLIDSIDDLKEEMEYFQKNGCVSGWNKELTYYTDTVPFYEKYKEDINELLVDECENCCLDLYTIIPGLDKDDLLMIYETNKNALAWFGFERMTNMLYHEIFENEVA